MAEVERWEYYNTGDDEFIALSVDGDAQTFTPSSSHTITSVKLLLYKLVGSPGTITVGIKATDESGHPTGDDLCSGTTEGNTLTEDTDGEWREITLGDGTDLDADKKYAIVVVQAGVGYPNFARWRMDGSSPTYTKGNREEYGAGAWARRTDDCMFEEWGEGVLGRPLTVKVMTIQHRTIKMVTTQHRTIKNTATTYRKIGLVIALYRKIKTTITGG